jgi:hypothetical protein
MSIPSASSRYPGGTGAAIGAGGSYSGTFIPQLWSSKLLVKFYDATVLSAVSNTLYEGEFANHGDTIKIRQRPNITIRNYSPDQELTVERPNATVIDFQIDYAHYFTVVLDDVYRVQADMDLLNMWTQDAAEAMKVHIDHLMLRNVFLGGAHPDNRGNTAGRISNNIKLGVTTNPVRIGSRENIYVAGTKMVTDLIMEMGQVLDEQNIPENDRWLIIPPSIATMIKVSELRDASLSGDGTSMLRNGRIGRLDRFTVYQSNLLPTGTADGLAANETAIFAGHPMAVTFASQINKVQRMESERTFGTVLRGLMVYGCKVLQSTALVQAIVKPGNLVS